MPTNNNTSMPARMDAGPKVTWVQGPGIELLNTYELHAIQNLFAWVAAEQDTAEDTVRGVTAARFGVEDVTGLPRKDYDEVIRFLVDLRIDELRD